MKREHWVILAIAVAGLAMLGLVAVKASVSIAGTRPLPSKQPQGDGGYPEHVVREGEHLEGYVYAAHRYPRACGMEVTSAIHHGWGTMRVPQMRDAQWLIHPPSEEVL